MIPGARDKKGRSQKSQPLILLLGCGLGLAIITGISGCLLFEKPPEIQKFILLSLDNLRADRLGCYGNQRNVSPCLDSLARQGAQFLSAFTPYPFTPPSHASMLTSLYPSVFDLPLDPKIPTLASLLAGHGYKTAALTSGAWMSAGYGILNGFAETDDRVIELKRLEDKTRKWLEQNADQKFFLFLHTYAVHVPFVAPEKYFREFADPGYSGPIQNSGDSTMAFIKEANEGKIAVSLEDRQRMLDIYDGQIRMADDFVYSLIDTLKRLGLVEKTMVIITSDHGEQFYEFQHFGHNSLARPFADISTRVPLIIYCPTLPRKGPVGQQIELVDLPPTVLEAAQIEAPETLQGKSVFPILRKRYRLGSKKKKEVFFQMERYAGVRTENWKLVLDFIAGEKNLYDLEKDPAEREAVSRASAARKMNSLMNKLRVFQEKNNALKEKLGITKIKLADALPSASLPFDARSVFLASLDDYSFSYRTKDSYQTDRLPGAKSDLRKGKFGMGLLLEPGTEVRFPVETALSASSGAIEFWFKIKEEAPQDQKIIQIDIVGPDSRLSIQFTVQWQWGGAPQKRGLVEIKTQAIPAESIQFPARFSWNNWHHVFIAWEDEEAFLFIDGILASRDQLSSSRLFEQEMTKIIRITGQNCILDELRVSHSSRLSHVRTNKAKLDKEAIERLKALGYVGTKEQ